MAGTLLNLSACRQQTMRDVEMVRREEKNVHGRSEEWQVFITGKERKKEGNKMKKQKLAPWK
jgi:hypothetical protein